MMFALTSWDGWIYDELMGEALFARDSFGSCRLWRREWRWQCSSVRWRCCGQCSHQNPLGNFNRCCGIIFNSPTPPYTNGWTRGISPSPFSWVDAPSAYLILHTHISSFINLEKISLLPCANIFSSYSEK